MKTLAVSTNGNYYLVEENQINESMFGVGTLRPASAVVDRRPSIAHLPNKPETEAEKQARIARLRAEGRCADQVS